MARGRSTSEAGPPHSRNLTPSRRFATCHALTPSHPQTPTTSHPYTLTPSHPHPHTLTPPHPHTLNPSQSHVVTCQEGPYRGTLLIRNNPSLGPYSRLMPRALWWSCLFSSSSYERGTPVVPNVRGAACLPGSQPTHLRAKSEHLKTCQGLFT